MANCRVMSVGDKSSSCWFSLPIAFDKWSSHDNLHEFVNFWEQRGTTWDHQSDSPPKSSFSFVEEERIIDFVGESSIGSSIVEFFA